MNIDIGDTVRRLRSHQSLTLKELSEKTGISLSYLSLIERNKRDPSLTNLTKIAEAFDLSPSILIFISTKENTKSKGAQTEISDQMMSIIKDCFRDDERFPALP